MTQPSGDPRRATPTWGFPRRGGGFLLSLLLALLSPNPAAAAAPDAGTAPLELVAPAVKPLPRYTERRLPKPDRESLARLDALTRRLSDPGLEVRFAARKAALELDGDWLPAIAARLKRRADSSDKPGMKALLGRVRHDAREAVRRKMGADGRTGEVVTPDYLEMLLAHADRSPPLLRPLIEVVAFSRMLEAIGTLPATRKLIGVYVRFGEFLRADTQLALKRLKDRSTAALIEATRHPAPRIATWARRQLQSSGRAQPSDAVQTLNSSVQADVLRAFGKVRRLDTLPLLISYAGSEKARVRLAARQAVGMFGDAGLWQLRDAHEKTLGRRAPREWSWDRVARELFAGFDRRRLEAIYQAYNRGLQAQRAGDLTAALAAFDRVLSWDPGFERGASMAPTYLQFARQRADTDREAALLSLSRAERLDPGGPTHDAVVSLRYTLDAERLLDTHLVDEVLLRRATELDPTNQRAATLLASLLDDGRQQRAMRDRYLAAGVIAALALMGLLVVALRQRRAQRASAEGG